MRLAVFELQKSGGRHIALAPNISEDGFNEVHDDVLGGGEIMPRKNSYSSPRSTAISPAIEGILRKSRKSSHNSNKVVFQTLKFDLCVINIGEI